MNTPNAGTIPYPQYKLEALSAPLLLMDDPELRRKFIEIIEKESPTQSYKIVEALMKLERFKNGDRCGYGGRKFTDKEAHEMAQAAHHLAALRRDYGQEAFDKLTQGRK